jgi:hypothetical protein
LQKPEKEVYFEDNFEGNKKEYKAPNTLKGLRAYSYFWPTPGYFSRGRCF